MRPEPVWHRPVESALIQRLRGEVLEQQKRLTADRKMLEAAIFIVRVRETVLGGCQERLKSALDAADKDRDEHQRTHLIT